MRRTKRQGAGWELAKPWERGRCSLRTKAGADDGEGQWGGQAGEWPEPVGNVKEDVEA